MNLKQNFNKGKIGEKIAQDYLLKAGYKIIDKNWHYSKNSEVDIIALKDDVLVFIEVKSRSTLNFGHPFEAINTNKMKKIYSAVYAYINSSERKYKSFRIDGIAIIGFNNPQIEHIKNIGQY